MNQIFSGGLPFHTRGGSCGGYGKGKITRGLLIGEHSGFVRPQQEKMSGGGGVATGFNISLGLLGEERERGDVVIDCSFCESFLTSKNAGKAFYPPPPH